MNRPIMHSSSARTTSVVRRPLLIISVAALLAAAACASGCGSSAHTAVIKATAAAPISKADFVAKANAICASADPTLNEANAKLASDHSPVAIEDVVKNTYLPSVQAQITGIRALGVPAGEQAAMTRMLRLLGADLKRLERNPRLVTTDVFGDFAKAAHHYGLVDCAPLS